VRIITTGTSKYTQVHATDKPEFNANHVYEVVARPQSQTQEGVASIRFQKGPIKEKGVNGCHHEDLIAIVIDRLQSFQNSDHKCRENALAITKLEEAIMWLNKRTQDRVNRGVEGISNV